MHNPPLRQLPLTVGRAKLAGIIVQPFFLTVADPYTVAGPSAVSGIRDENGLPIINK
ncbi:MAG: hypothetical protein NTV33_00080 [Coprothermobacterota bacterium]|nr:hypothetical protein [Coprothermobacterota bacterium]